MTHEKRACGTDITKHANKVRGIQLKFQEAQPLYLLLSRGLDFFFLNNKIIFCILMYFIFSFRYMWGHVREKNTVQGFPPGIYTILYFA